MIHAYWCNHQSQRQFIRIYCHQATTGRAAKPICSLIVGWHSSIPIVATTTTTRNYGRQHMTIVIPIRTKQQLIPSFDISYTTFSTMSTTTPKPKPTPSSTSSLSPIRKGDDESVLVDHQYDQPSQQLTDNNDDGIHLPIIMADNPCWGSPTRCQLIDLLAIINPSTSILYESNDYIVLNKPPDLRMDGPYPATVHKLLTYWYPPPSLLVSFPPNKTQHHHHNPKLLQAISTLHQHNHVLDNELRPCHQLDYATSGVLLIARSSSAAAQVNIWFEQRLIQKTYRAILHGNLMMPTTASAASASTTTNTMGTNHPLTIQWVRNALPILSQKTVQQRLEQLERRYRKERRQRNRPKKSTTFSGYQPTHALFHKYKSLLQRQQQQQQQQQKQQKRQKQQQQQDEPESFRGGEEEGEGMEQMTTTPSSRNTKRARMQQQQQQQQKQQQHSQSQNQQPISSLLSNDDWKDIWDPVENLIMIQGQETTANNIRRLSFLLEPSYNKSQGLILAIPRSLPCPQQQQHHHQHQH